MTHTLSPLKFAPQGKPVTSPCLVQASPWQPLSRAKCLMMAIQLRRIRAITQRQGSSWPEENSDARHSRDLARAGAVGALRNEGSVSRP